MTRFDVRVLSSDDDVAQALALHRREFGESRDEAWWSWRFEGRARAKLVGAFDGGGRCHALYAGLWQRLWIRGETAQVLIHSDIAVDGSLRESLGGAVLLRRATREFMDGVPDEGLRLMYGFPQPALLRFLVRELRAEVLTDLVFLVHDLVTSPISSQAVVTESVEHPSDDVDRLWRRFREEVGAALVRDRDYLDGRFARHPLVDYELLECRDASSGELRGVAALREGGWDPAIATVSEWLVPGDDEEAERALLEHAIRWARERDRSWLVSWFATADARFDRWQAKHAFFARASPYQELFISYTPGVDRGWLREGWYQTMGDIDFF